MELNVLLDLLMFATACIFLMAGYPVAFTLAGTALLFAFIGYGLGEFDLDFIGYIPQRIFGTMTNEVLLAVPLFVFMGVMLERSKVAEDLLDSMGQLMGRLRGGLGISVTIVGALLAASTGIVGATVVTMGLLSLPTLLRRGYSPALATGSIAAAGTLGQIIPPSIVLVLLGDQLSSAYQQAQLEMGIFSPEPLSVGDLFAGALIPGLGLVGLYITYQLLVAFFLPKTSPAVPRDEVQIGDPSFMVRVLGALLPPVLLIVAVLGSILLGIATPTEAAAVGAVGALLLAGYKLDPARGKIIIWAGLAIIALLALTSLTDLRLQDQGNSFITLMNFSLAVILSVLVVLGLAVSLMRVWSHDILNNVMQSTTKISSMVFVILIGAALFSLVFKGFEGDEFIYDFLSDLPGGKATALLLVMLVMFFLGFFLDFIEITFVVVPIVAPVLLQMDINPIWLGVMMAMNLQTSFLTPPFGFALFYLRGVAPPGVTTWQIYKGVIPFVLIQILAIYILWNFPALTTWLPSIIFAP